MDSLKRIITLVASLAGLAPAKTKTENLANDSVTSRVSRDVSYYRTHFFNV